MSSPTRTARRIVESGEALSVSNAEIRALAEAYLEMEELLEGAANALRAMADEMVETEPVEEEEIMDAR